VSGDLAAIIRDHRERFAGYVDHAIIVAVLFDMVVKPLS
jgi:hypothetical protein